MSVKLLTEHNLEFLAKMEASEAGLSLHLPNVKLLEITCLGSYMGLAARKPIFRVCEQHRGRPACASMQSDQRLCYSRFVKCHI